MVCAAYPGSEKQEAFQLSGDGAQLAEGAAEVPDMEACPVFTGDQLPPQRQLYYQLCDLRDPSLQALIHANDGREEKCSVSNLESFSELIYTLCILHES